MNVTAMRLRNFRGFRDARIQIKPLTVLLGPNSSGKSSFGHALASMAHAQREMGGSSLATLSPVDADRAQAWPVDLGQYADLCTEGVRERVFVDLLTRDGWCSLGFGALEVPELLLSYIRLPLRFDTTEPARISPRITVAPPLATSGGTERVVRDPTPASGSDVELLRIHELQWATNGGVPVTVSLDGLVLNAFKLGNMTENSAGGKARDDLRFLLSDLSYLRATRKRPSRGSADRRVVRNALGYAGEWTASFLQAAQSTRPLVRYCAPQPIPSTVDEAAATIDVPWQEVSMPLLEAVAYWLRHLGLAEGVQTRESRRDPGLIETRITFRGGETTRDITEVGFGLSQILPVIVAGLSQRENGPLIVDLPEAHLHPRPQAALADFFCSLALSGRTTIVETHSEMLFHRLRLRAAMNSALKSMISVYFFDAADGRLCLPPREVGLDFESELRWPVGFLHEGWEAEEQIGAVRAARQQS
jgi:hypothetical protein